MIFHYTDSIYIVSLDVKKRRDIETFEFASPYRIIYTERFIIHKTRVFFGFKTISQERFNEYIILTTFLFFRILKLSIVSLFDLIHELQIKFRLD